MYGMEWVFWLVLIGTCLVALGLGWINDSDEGGE